ncbi:MAG: DUF952 domain-containing protein [Acidimicrobiia bacterium]|nr:DUF952 domain-containing protein [Acidimicrobiia bacterium]
MTTDAEWSVAVDRGFHRPATFGDDGFVHASNADQVARTVRRFYADVPDLVVLEIDVARLDASCPVVDEPGDADSSGPSLTSTVTSRCPR